MPSDAVGQSVSRSGRTGRQLNLAQYSAAVLVDGQVYWVVGVETDQFEHAVEYLYARPHTSFTLTAAILIGLSKEIR